MALPALVKLGLVGAVAYLALRKKVGGGEATVSGDAPVACRSWPSLGQRWTICHGGAGTAGTGNGPFTGVQIPVGAHYAALYHVSPPNPLVAVINLLTYDKETDSAEVVAVPVGGKLIWREQLVPETTKVPLNLGGNG